MIEKQMCKLYQMSLLQFNIKMIHVEIIKELTMQT